MPKIITPFKAGDRLSAKKMNDIAQWIVRLSNITASPPFEITKTPGSINLRLNQRPKFWAKITGGTNPYSWTRQQRLASDTFTNDPSGQSGTTSVDPAYEWNGITTVPAGKIVELEIEPATGQRIFQLEIC